MVDTERTGPDDDQAWADDEDRAGDGSVAPLSPTGDADAVRTADPDGHDPDDAAPLPLETPPE